MISIIFFSFAFVTAVFGMDKHTVLPEDYKDVLGDIISRNFNAGFHVVAAEIKSLAEQKSIWHDSLEDEECAGNIVTSCDEHYKTYIHQSQIAVFAIGLNTVGTRSWCKKYLMGRPDECMKIDHFLTDICRWRTPNIALITCILELNILPAKRAALGCAITHNPQLVPLLLEYETNVDSRSFFNDYTALMQAASWNKLDIVDLLISKGANVNATGHGNRTALHLASHECNFEIVQKLLDAGAHVDTQYKDGEFDETETALSFMRKTKMGTQQKRDQIIDLLKKHGAQE